MATTAFDDYGGYRSWLAGAASSGSDTFRVHQRDGQTIAVDETSGMVTIAGDANDGSTAWFADVLEAGRPGSERNWGQL